MASFRAPTGRKCVCRVSKHTCVWIFVFFDVVFRKQIVGNLRNAKPSQSSWGCVVASAGEGHVILGNGWWPLVVQAEAFETFVSLCCVKHSRVPRFFCWGSRCIGVALRVEVVLGTVRTSLPMGGKSSLPITRRSSSTRACAVASSARFDRGPSCIPDLDACLSVCVCVF